MAGLVIKTLPASYHRPELDLTKDTVALSRDRFEGGLGSLSECPSPGHLN
jgi:hypothetical protein